MRLRPTPSRHLDPTGIAYGVHGPALARENGMAADRAERSEAGRPAGRSPGPVKPGESPERKAGAIVDWFKFTFLPDGSISDALEQLRKYFHLVFSVPVTMKPAGKGFRRYEFSYDLLAFINGETMKLGIVACGGEHVGGTILVDWPGQGCTAIGDWQAVYAMVQDLDARITRCDLAMDFCQGEVSIAQMEELYYAGDFNAGGRIPTYRKIESGVAGSKGCRGTTFEIGRRANGKMLRAYEKGRQLGNQDSEWVRLEIEFGAKDRVIPHEILIKRDQYFAGAYKALEAFMAADPQRVPTDQVKALELQDETIRERKLKHIQTQFGPTVDYELRCTEEDIAALVVAIRRQGVPAQLHKSALARHVYGTHDPVPKPEE
ncbi:replication initiation protein [Ralstonia pseudosolanacearum]|nr:replication initiation protein [Ralstonia pseudosolanacearum]RAA16234.1 replication initiation protein [Ralstonia pseudosolanacearum]